MLAPSGDEEQEITTPIDFRRYFISLIKSMTEGSNMFSRFEEDKPGYSPYVFSINFKKIVGIKRADGKMIVKPPIYITISTGIFDVMTSICNGAIKHKGKTSIMDLVIKDVRLLPFRQISSPNVVFRITSHAILRGIDGYIDGTDYKETEEAINTHMLSHFSFIHGTDRVQLTDDSISPVTIAESRLRKGVCFHYGGMLTTLKGQIRLTGTPASLQFLYDFGLGVRAGQGFGLLEVVREL